MAEYSFPPVIYEDNHLLSVNKPAGMLVQGDETGDRTLSDLMKIYIAERYGKPGAVFLGVIHRIDRPVSGVVLLARTSKALSRMNEQFRDRSVSKCYLAIVLGRTPAEGSLVHWLRKNPTVNRVTVFSKVTDDAWRCELYYRRISTENEMSLLEVRPVTGRPHQIRAQLSAIGYPIVGDVKYGAPEPLSDKSIALHSRKLEFLHPVLKQPMISVAPLPVHPVWQPFRVHVT